MSKESSQRRSEKLRLDRVSTSFAIRLFEHLKTLKIEEGDPFSFLKYHQNVVRDFMNNISTESRGLLIYHSMGMGKTIMGATIAMDSIGKRQVIILLSKSLQQNFEKGIRQYFRYRSRVDPSFRLGRASEQEKDDFIKKNFSFVSMNASNMIKQVVDATEGTLGKEYKKALKKKDLLDEKIEAITNMGSLDNKLLIVDEAHNLFRAITNGSKNGHLLYEMVMKAKNLRIVFLTGTPISNDPFELVPCFNMLAGGRIPLLPETWKDFYKYFVNRDLGTIKNKDKFQNRIMGLVSHVSHLSKPGKASGQKITSPPVEFPEELPNIVEFLPMTPDQYMAYQLAREKEKNEVSGFRGPERATPSMQKPKGDAVSSYRQRSRQISNFAPPAKYAEKKFSEIPIRELPKADVSSPKLEKLLENIEKSPGIGYVYSQFVSAGGLGAIMRFLELRGWELYSGQRGLNLKKIIEREEASAEKEFESATKEDTIATYDKSAPLNKKRLAQKIPLPEDKRNPRNQSSDDYKLLADQPKPVADQESKTHEPADEQIEMLKEPIKLGGITEVHYLREDANEIGGALFAEPYLEEVLENYRAEMPVVLGGAEDPQEVIIAKFYKNITGYDLPAESLKRYQRAPNKIIRIDEGGELVGVALVKVDKDELQIKALVSKDVEVAKKLFDKVKSEVDKGDFAKVSFEVAKRNGDFYKSLGCVAVGGAGEHHCMCYHRHDDVHKIGGQEENLRQLQYEDQEAVGDFIRKETAEDISSADFDKFLASGLSHLIVETGDRIVSLILVEEFAKEYFVDYLIGDQAQVEQLLNKVRGELSEDDFLHFRLHRASHSYELARAKVSQMAQALGGGEDYEYYQLRGGFDPTIRYSGGRDGIDLSAENDYLGAITGEEGLTLRRMTEEDLKEDGHEVHQFKEKYIEEPYISYVVVGKSGGHPKAHMVLKAEEDKLWIKKLNVSNDYADTELPHKLIHLAIALGKANGIPCLYAKIKAEKTITRGWFEAEGFTLVNFRGGRWLFEYGGAPGQPCADIIGGQAKKRKKVFAFITGEVPPEDRQQIQNVFNSPENKYGGVIDFILLSSTGAEGLDLKNVRHEHIFEPYWNYARIKQIKARGIRNNAHQALPEDQRNVQVYIYLATKPASEVPKDIDYQKLLREEMTTGNSPVLANNATTDIELYTSSLKNERLIDSFNQTLKEVSIECMINGEPYCRSCAPNDVKLFRGDIDQDMRSRDPCAPVEEKKVKAKEIEFDGKKYYYVRDADNIHGWKIYQFDKKINNYVPLGEDATVFFDLVDEIKEREKTKK